MSLFRFRVYLATNTHTMGGILSPCFTFLLFISSHLQATATQACRWQIMIVLSPLACCACVCVVGVGAVSVKLSASSGAFSSTWLSCGLLTGRLGHWLECCLAD